MIVTVNARTYPALSAFASVFSLLYNAVKVKNLEKCHCTARGSLDKIINIKAGHSRRSHEVKRPGPALIQNSPWSRRVWEIPGSRPCQYCIRYQRDQTWTERTLFSKLLNCTARSLDLLFRHLFQMFVLIMPVKVFAGFNTNITGV